MHNPPGGKLSRRSFMKNASLGALSAGFAPTLLLPRPADLSEGGFRYHPDLDPLRVVGLFDKEMTRELKPLSPWRVQDPLVNRERVEENIDRLAGALAGEKMTRDAWKRIFLKPPGKSWNETTVAIKTNNLGQQHTRSAVMAKICRVLTDDIGVKPSRLFIYDASHGKDMRKKSPFTGLPEDVKVAGDWGGFTGEAEVGAPYLDGKTKTKCLGQLVKGEVDILVNIAVCKGHQPVYGGFTMCMKNHLGTFDPMPAHRMEKTEYLIGVNKNPLLLGHIDRKAKKILYPRQQLCLVDALWASENGPGCPSSAQPNRLFMGIFAPAVDVLVARDFRQKSASWPIDEVLAIRFLQEFGFRSDGLPKSWKIVEVNRPV